MAKDLNEATLTCRLGAEPTVSRTQDGKVIVNVSVATSYSYQDKQTGQKITKTEWHRLVFFNKLAEVAEKYLHKGDRILARGPLRTRKWTDKQGIERYTTEIIMSEMIMLGSPQGKGQQESSPYKPDSSENNDYQQADNFKADEQPHVFDDDIPF